MASEENMTELRQAIWEKKYPGCTEDFNELIGTPRPSYKKVCSWKRDWKKISEFKTKIEHVDDFRKTTENIASTIEKINIHPYFWFLEHEGVSHNHYYEVNIVVSFVKEEYLL